MLSATGASTATGVPATLTPGQVPTPVPNPIPRPELPDVPEFAARVVRLAVELLTWPPVLAAVVCAVTVAVGLITGVVVGRLADGRRRRAGGLLLAVRPPAAVDPAGGEVLWRTLLGLHRPRWRRALFGQPHVAVELAADADGPRMQVWVPGGVPPGLIEHALTAAWPGTRVDEQPAAPPVPTTGTGTGGTLRLAGPDWFPLRTKHEVDPARPLLAALSGLRAGESACVQVLARPAPPVADPAGPFRGGEAAQPGR